MMGMCGSCAGTHVMGISNLLKHKRPTFLLESHHV